MKVSPLICLLAILSIKIASVTSANANFLSNTLGSNMVLQRAPQSSNLWGWTGKGVVTTLVWNGKTINATGGDDGLWLISLPPTPAGGPHKFNLKSSQGDSAVLQNVLFGDVFFCSGQSNMEFGISSAFNASTEIKAADKYPNVRFVQVARDVSDKPKRMVYQFKTKWSVASSKTIVNGKDYKLDSWGYISAVCWFFGKNVYDNAKVPVGLVASTWGGTQIQSWMNPEALAECPTKPTADFDDDEEMNQVATPTPAPIHPRGPSILYNAMVAPFLNMRVSGFAWYQAESNVGHAPFYQCAFPAMIRHWRKNFPSGDSPVPFYFVQLSTWLPKSPTNGIPDMRLAQTAALSLPNVGMAVAYDLGDINSPKGNIHPRNKQEVGRRLALNALAMQYGKKVVREGPTALSAKTKADNTGTTVEIVIDPKTLGSPIVSKLLPKYCPNASYCGNTAEIQSEDGGWLGARIRINNNSVFFSVPTKIKAKAVRYAYADWPVPDIYNKDGLPMPPFVLSL